MSEPLVERGLTDNEIILETSESVRALFATSNARQTNSIYSRSGLYRAPSPVSSRTPLLLLSPYSPFIISTKGPNEHQHT